MFITSGEKVLSTLSTGATEVFEITGSSRRTGIMADDFEVLLSTWVLSFDDFVVAEDLEMRLAGEGEG